MTVLKLLKSFHLPKTSQRNPLAEFSLRQKILFTNLGFRRLFRKTSSWVLQPPKPKGRFLEDGTSSVLWVTKEGACLERQTDSSENPKD